MDVTAPRSAGGTKFDPQTAEQAREILAPQLQELISAASQLNPQLRSDNHIYFEARLLPNYIAASQYPSTLLEQIGAIPVGSRADRSLYRTKAKQEESSTRRLVLAVRDEGLLEFSQLVTGNSRTRSEHEAFEEIRKFDELRISSVEPVLRNAMDEDREFHTWEAILHPAAVLGAAPTPLDDSTLGKWFTLVDQVGGTAHRDFVRTVGGLTFSPITLDTEAVLEVAQFNPLRTIRPMPAIRPRPRFGTRSVAKLQPPTNSQPIQDHPAVAIFDGGFEEPSSVIVPRSAPDITAEAAKQDELNHGTGVTGAALCGLALPGTNAVQPSLPVDSFRVLPAPPMPNDLESYWILDRIKDTIIANGHKIVNLSIGPTLAVEDSMEPDRWTSELDRLAWEHDVLFIVAAGNYGNVNQATGLHRVQVPGDMANGLTVGACDGAPPAKPWARAPYSSMGPGRQGNRIQPLGVQFGGTDAEPFPVIRADGSFLEATGTSFAAPLVTHALADLTTRLPRANPSVLRAFAAHFAERHRTHKKLQDELGYGRLPLNFASHLDCAPNEAHVLYVDEIKRGELIGYKVPIPSGAGAVEVRITLAYASPVESSQPTEYTHAAHAALELAFRPHSRIYNLRPPKGEEGRPVTLDISSPEALSLLSAGWQVGQEPVTVGLGSSGKVPEHHLRDSGKWETVRHSRISLKVGGSFDPRLEISYVARRAGAIDNSATKVPFALLISVIDEDESGATDLYDRIAAQYAALRPVQRARGRLRLGTGGARGWN
ncbi:MAG: S8 family peptidase [Pseudonocardiaceae bacterium]